jgi:hypothetical protein
VITSLVSFFFAIQDAAYTQTVAHDVLSYHREVSRVIDETIRSGTDVEEVGLPNRMGVIGGDSVVRSFALENGGLTYTSSTVSESLVSRRVQVDRFEVSPVQRSNDTIGVTYILGVRSSAPDQQFSVQTTSTILFRAQP